PRVDRSDQHGPITATILNEWLSKGIIGYDTYVWAADGSMKDWTTIRDWEPLYQLCAQPFPATMVDPDAKNSTAEEKAPPSAMEESSNTNPPVFFIHDTDLVAVKDYLRNKRIAQIFGLLASVPLACVAGMVVAFGGEALSGVGACTVDDSLFLRIVMAWVTFFGLILFLAELKVSIIRTYFHVLAYRPGRIATTFFCSTLLAGNALCGVPTSDTLTEMSHGDFRNFIKMVHWPIVGVVSLSLISGVINFQLARKTNAVRQAMAMKAHAKKEPAKKGGSLMDKLRGPTKRDKELV
ncbi:MAG: hypothetical protein SGPRY_010739, partial [Prymnesium sp.]